MPRLPLCALVLCASSAAWAQGSTMTGQGSCTGQVTASIGIAATKNPEADPASQERASVSLSYAPYVFGKAECDCNTSDVYMRLQISMGLPAGTQGNPTVWVGTSACSSYMTRATVNQTQCQQYAPSNVNATSFNAGSGNIGTTTFFDIAIPARALFSPNAGSCDISTASNQVFIFIGPDQTMPVATCTLPLTEQVTGPTAVVNGKAESGDGAVTVIWDSPPVGSLQPDSYQVLCADEDGNPLPDVAADPAYSTCLATGIRRRQNIFGATSIVPGGTGDGGVAATDLGVSSSAFGLSAAGGDAPREPYTHDDGGVHDLGTDDGGSDAGTGTTLTSPIRPTQSGLPAPFDTLDPRFICSERIPVNAQNYQRRVEGLTNNRRYQFVVLSIDLYGNATPSTVFTGEPKPVDDLYGRYRAAGGNAQGFCFVATAAFGDYDHPQVRVLRAFRDRVLDDSRAGRAVIRAYYRLSPPLARFVAASALRRGIARAVLWPLVGLALLALRLGSLALALAVAVGVPGLALLGWRRRRRRRAPCQVPA